MPPGDWDLPGSSSNPNEDIAGYDFGPDPRLPSAPSVNQGHGDGKGDGSHQLGNPSTSPTADLTGLLHDLNTMNAGDQSNPAGARHSVRGVELAHITQFMEGYNAISGVNKDIAQDVRVYWGGVRDKVQAAVADLQRLKDNGDIKGEAATAIKQQAQTLIDSLTFVAGGAARMAKLVDMFSQDVARTHEFFTQDGLYERVQYAIQNNDPDVVDWANNATMIVVRDQYNPPIYTVSQNHPDLPAAPTVPSDTSGPGSGTGAHDGGSTALPDELLANGRGVPDALLGKEDNDGDRGQNKANSASGLDGLGNAAQGAGDAAGNAAKGAQQAASDALGNLLGDKKGSGLPDGTPSTDPSRSGGLVAGLGAGRSGGAPRGGGPGPGLGTREVPTAKPATQPVASTKAATPATPTSRAGLSNTGSSGGSGAPAAGHRGGATDKQHKASKALRADHGVISEGDAVVAVVGDEPKEQRTVPARST